MIAVTFALPSESSAFLRLLEQPAREAAGPHTISGTLHGRAICILHTGVGEKTTRPRLAHFLQEQSPQLLISSGFAGALNENWKLGEVIAAENYSTNQLGPKFAEDYRPGRLATASAMVDSPNERQALAREGVDAVDMETEFIAAACSTANVQLLSLRVITDTPAHPFPAPPHLLFDVERQRTPFFPLFAHLLLRPTSIGRFISFARAIDGARESLTLALASVIERVPVEP
ncbi:MAG: hypothetical protein ABI946_05580 [Chthoniobacterales bacterium]